MTRSVLRCCWLSDKKVTAQECCTGSIPVQECCLLQHSAQNTNQLNISPAVFSEAQAAPNILFNYTCIKQAKQPTLVAAGNGWLQCFNTAKVVTSKISE